MNKNHKQKIIGFMVYWLLGIGCLLPMPCSASAFSPEEMLLDQQLENRARAISQQLRCPVCSYETIFESDSILARDLRFFIRQQLLAGESDTKIIAFITDRYGKDLLLTPFFSGWNLILWLFSPFLFMLASFYFIYNLWQQKKLKNSK